MTIEFHTPHGKVPEKLVSTIRNEVLELLHINKKISRAEVMMREEMNNLQGENDVCEIRLSIYGDNLFVHGQAVSFEKAARIALKELKRLVRQQVKKHKEVPDQKLSTVKV